MGQKNLQGASLEEIKKLLDAAFEADNKYVSKEIYKNFPCPKRFSKVAIKNPNTKKSGIK